MSGSLSGQLAFVTFEDGMAASGRSGALAQALVDAGALVVLVVPDARAGGRLAGSTGAQAVFCPGSDAEADVRALVELAADLLRSDGHGPGRR
ncbi:MAG: hypothetical protein M3011_09275 [Actinomycetota bacterium]|nr:hypothetical protein [Actinomycetota bacterium]